MKNVLTIAGSDSSGGAGIQADMKTFCAHQCYAMSVITAITAQNTQGVTDIMDCTPQIIEAQINAVFDDIQVDAVKIGMVSVPETIKVIADRLRHYKASPVVVDPVMVSKSGYHLLKPEAKEALIEELLPLASVITPNIPEAEVLVGREIKTLKDMEDACMVLHKKGVRTIFLKGGHRAEDATDILFDGTEFHRFVSQRIDTKNTHGTGCSLSSAIAANLALGKDLVTSVKDAKNYVYTGILHAENLGHGWGPIHHFYSLYEKAKKATISR